MSYFNAIGAFTMPDNRENGDTSKAHQSVRDVMKKAVANHINQKRLMVYIEHPSLSLYKFNTKEDKKGKSIGRAKRIDSDGKIIYSMTFDGFIWTSILDWDPFIINGSRAKSTFIPFYPTTRLKTQ